MRGLELIMWFQGKWEARINSAWGVDKYIFVKSWTAIATLSLTRLPGNGCFDWLWTCHIINSIISSKKYNKLLKDQILWIVEEHNYFVKPINSYIICDVCYMICEVQDLIYCKILTPWVKGRPKYPIWEISELLSDISKMISGGSCMYTISCKASYH